MNDASTGDACRYAYAAQISCGSRLHRPWPKRRQSLDRIAIRLALRGGSAVPLAPAMSGADPLISVTCDMFTFPSVVQLRAGLL
jgi:hypothetical protein